MLKNPKETKDNIVHWIRQYFDDNGKDCSAVIGISGGKDSSVVAALCVEALGKDRVLGVLMPDGTQADIEDSFTVVKELDIPYKVIDIHQVVTAAGLAVGGELSLTRQAEINIPPRIRMMVLYAVAQCLPNGGRVANTCNFSENYVGYSTKYGDHAGDFSPLANLLMHEVLQIGHELPISSYLVDKTPSDGLCGKTDEDNFGFTYEMLDNYILTGRCDDPAIKDKIDALHLRNIHKLTLMPTYYSYMIRTESLGER